MGNIGHKFFLIILRAGNLAGHIGEAGGQISHFILAVQGEFIVHIAGGVLLCGIGYFAQGQIYKLRKEDQNDQGQQKQNDQRDI